MALLAVLRWQPSGELNGGYGDLEIIDVLPADVEPGERVVANDPPRFGFFYISDRDYDDPAVTRYLEREFGPPDENGEVALVRNRKWRMVRNAIPGNAARFLTYHPWGADGSTVPNNVKFTASQFVNFIEDRTA